MKIIPETLQQNQTILLNKTITVVVEEKVHFSGIVCYSKAKYYFKRTQLNFTFPFDSMGSYLDRPSVYELAGFKLATTNVRVKGSFYKFDNQYRALNPLCLVLDFLNIKVEARVMFHGPDSPPFRNIVPM